LAYAGALPVPQAVTARPQIGPPGRLPRRGLRHKILDRLAGPGMGACFSLALLMAVGGYGAVKGGHYAAYVATHGQPADIAAKALGFSIKAVTIAGERELKEQDLLAIAGISPRNSLLFLDAAKIRERLQRLPLVKEAAVTKLYPDRLLIEIEERQPFALWQCDGQVRIVAADGVPVAAMRDQLDTYWNRALEGYVHAVDQAGGVLVDGRVRERDPGREHVSRRHRPLVSLEHDVEGSLAGLAPGCHQWVSW